MTPASPLLRRHLFHFPGDAASGPLPPALADYLAFADLKDTVLSSYQAPTEQRRATGLSLVTRADGTYLQAELQLQAMHSFGYRNVGAYVHYLRAVRRLGEYLGSHLSQSGATSLLVSDEERSRLLGRHARLASADADTGLVTLHPHRNQPMLLQHHPGVTLALLDELANDPGGARMLVFFADRDTPTDISQQGSWLPDDELMAGATRTTGFASDLSMSATLFIGPAHFTPTFEPAGEGYGSEVIDRAWLEAGAITPALRTFGLRTPLEAPGATPADRLLPFIYRGPYDNTNWLPLDHADHERLARAITAVWYTRQSRMSVHDGWQEDVVAHFPQRARTFAVARVRTWLEGRHTQRIARLQRRESELMEQVSSHQAQAVAAARAADDVRREVGALAAAPSGVSEDDLTGLSRLLEKGVLTSFAPHAEGDGFTFTTRTLYVKDERSGAHHELGAYRVDVNLSPNPDELALRFTNETRQVTGYHGGMQHPHVWGNGKACEGNFIEVQTDLLLRRDWLSLTEMSIAFLESVNVNDAAGRHVHKWPFVADPAAVGLPPYQGEVAPYASESERRARDIAERLAERELDEDGYDENGFDREGYHVTTGEFYDEEGYNVFGFNPDGFNRDGEHERGGYYDADGYDRDGYDENGFDVNGIHTETDTRYNPDGFDRYGDDRQGYHSHDGRSDRTYDEDGYDEHGYDRGGYDNEGYDEDGLTADGEDRRGYTRDADEPYGHYDAEGFDPDGYDRGGVNVHGDHRPDDDEDEEEAA